MAKKLYIIDGHAHIYAAYYAPIRQQLTSPTGEPTKATYIFTTTILSLIQNRKPDMLIVAMDSKAPTFRTKIYLEYKAHRPPMPDDMPVQIDHIEQILNAMNIPILRLDGFEADDIIGTLAKEAGWIIIRRNLIGDEDRNLALYLERNVKGEYKKIEIDYSDIKWPSMPNPYWHKFRTVKNENKVIIYSN